MADNDDDVRALVEKQAHELLCDLADQVRAQAALAGSKGDEALAHLLLSIADRVEALAR